jgi:NAD+ synthase (glutamine-hydrolysing)
MGISNQEGHLVLATGNKSELAVGYSTLYGDAVGGFAPIKDIYKTDVWALSRFEMHWLLNVVKRHQFLNAQSLKSRALNFVQIRRTRIHCLDYPLLDQVLRCLRG